MDETNQKPWVSGPEEILRHGLELQEQDTESSRRLAMIVIDNAVELSIKTYLSLPPRITGISISKREYRNISESFPRLLDALESHAPDQLEGIDLGEIEWYHRLRNKLYHEGNGLTVGRNKLVVYAEIARSLLIALFHVDASTVETHPGDPLVEFLAHWGRVESAIRTLASDFRIEDKGPSGKSGSAETLATIDRLGYAGIIGPEAVRKLHELRTIRKAIVHSELDESESVSHSQVDDLDQMASQLEDLIHSQSASDTLKAIPHGSGTNKGARYLEFYRKVIENLTNRHGFKIRTKARTDNWIAFASGVTGIRFGLTFRIDNKACVELWMSKASYMKAIPSRERIERKIDSSLVWENLDSHTGALIAIRRPGSILNDNTELVEIGHWMVDFAVRFREHLLPVLAE